jgi:hypothetical protein
MKHKQTTGRQPAAPSPAQSVNTGMPERRLHWTVVLVLLLLPLIFYGKYLLGNRMLFGTDWLGAGGYQMREFMARYIAAHHDIAFWVPGVLSGQPTLAAFFGDLFYPTALLRLFVPVHIVWTLTFWLQVFLAGLGTYLFLRELKVSLIPAALAGVAYMFAGSLLTLTYAGHDGRLIGSSLMPLALFFLQRGISRRQLVQFLLCGLIVALQLFSGHVQKVYYTGMMLVAFFLFQLIGTLRHERSAGLGVRLCGYFTLAMLFAGALSAIQYLPIYGNMPFAARGGERGFDYATSWSMPIVETFDLVTPKFSGGLASYWSSNPFKLHSEYLGILPLLFAAIAVFRRWKDRRVKFFTFGFLGTLLLAWGGNTPFYYIPYYLFPGISKFRGPAMIFFLAAFSLAALAGLGIEHLLRDAREPEGRKDLRTTATVAGIPLLLLVIFTVGKGALMPLLASTSGNAPQKTAALAANYPSMLGGFLTATVFAALGAGLVYLLLRRRVNPVWFSAACAVIMTLDIGLSLNLWNESKGYIRGVPPPNEYFVQDEATSFLKTDSSLYRVLPLNYEFSDDGRLMGFGIQNAGGQMPNPLQSYQDFTGAGSSVMFQAGNLMAPNFMNLLGIKYVISVPLPEDVSHYDEQSQRAIAQLRGFFGQPWFEPAHVGQRCAVYRNRSALPRAFLVPGYEVVKTKDDVIGRLRQPGFNPARTALLYDNPGFTPSGDTMPGSADVTQFDANRIIVRCHANSTSLLVLSENWHPDWKAYVDGKPAPLLRAYLTLRAVALPTGEHEAVFRYESMYYRLGSISTLVGFVFFMAVATATLVRRRKSVTSDPPA